MRQGVRNKKDGTAEEVYVAKALGTRLVAGSGSQNEKGDSRTRGEIRVENKHTSKAGYRLTGVQWEKLHSPSIQAGELPVFVIALASPRTGVTRGRAVVMPLDHLQAYDEFEEYLPRAQVEGVLKSFSITLANAERVTQFTLEAYHREKPFVCVVLPWSDFLDIYEEHIRGRS